MSVSKKNALYRTQEIRATEFAKREMNAQYAPHLYSDT